MEWDFEKIYLTKIDEPEKGLKIILGTNPEEDYKFLKNKTKKRKTNESSKSLFKVGFDIEKIQDLIPNLHFDLNSSNNHSNIEINEINEIDDDENSNRNNISSNTNSEHFEYKETKFPPFENEDKFLAYCPIEFETFQIEALRWMHYLESQYKNSQYIVGGILADEMGMGKTIDCLGMLYHDYYFLESQNLSNNHNHRPSLIITTLTVLDQWKSECVTKFKIPEQDILVYHGTNRLKQAKSSKAKIILTNYDTIVKDYNKWKLEANEPKSDILGFHQTNFGFKNQFLKNEENEKDQNEKMNQESNIFDLSREEKVEIKHFLFQTCWYKIFMDEAHVARNKQKTCFQSCKSFKTKFLYCVTGTPIFNRKEDLQTLSLLCTPFYSLSLKDITSFAKWKNKFLLRRFRKDCDLPPIQIEHVWLDFAEKEKIEYDNIRNEFIISTKQKEPDEILSLLVQLRQLTLHQMMINTPKWIGEQDWNNPQWIKYHNDAIQNKLHHSGKTIKIIEIIKQHKNEKVIIFSQFTSMLDIIKALIKRDLNLSVLCFDGRITKRSQRNHIIHEFNTNPNEKILLLSLKAGYMGLNLVASTVEIICDPWWNAAVERQAYKRIHRIGQTKPVTIYRLLTKNSIEKDMIEIQQEKDFEENGLKISQKEYIHHLYKMISNK